MLSVLGEAIVDLVAGAGVAGADRTYRAHPGGSPLNVAVGLARLGQPVTLRARLSRDGFGRMFRAHLAAAGVDPRDLVEATQPSTLAVASVDPAGVANYDFWTEGTADWQWTAAELAGPLPDDVVALHTGSLATALDPGATVIERLLRAERDRGRVTISYDPNVRPALLGAVDDARPRIEALVGLAHLVKVSADDLDWLYPGEDPAVVAGRWVGAGPALVVVTLGGEGVVAVSGRGHTVRRPAVPVTVVDTVGAGDAFTAGLLGALADRNLLGTAAADRLADLGDLGDLAALLDRAGLVAAITCARPGADPPTAAEVAAVAAE